MEEKVFILHIQDNGQSPGLSSKCRGEILVSLMNEKGNGGGQGCLNLSALSEKVQVAHFTLGHTKQIYLCNYAYVNNPRKEDVSQPSCCVD